MAKRKNKTIMVLEDEVEFAQLLKESLEDEGYAVALFEDATSALDFIEANHVDLVISDLLIKKDGRFLPDGGIKLISMLKQTIKHPAPIIAISGSFAADQYQAISTAMTVGADKTLAKPIKPSELIELVASYL